MDFREWLGGEDTINTYCRNLARAGGKRIAQIMGTQIMDVSENFEETLNMVNVELPLHNIPADKIDYVQDTLRDKLLIDFKVYAAHFYHNGRFWTRLSAQVYNEVGSRLCSRWMTIDHDP
jgi:hercynylcysteine S-oxide lyase